MPKRKITVSFNGKVIDTRQTDRLYTHALVLCDFDPEVLRQRWTRDWAPNGALRRNAVGSFNHAFVARDKGYKYASVVSDEDRARYSAIVEEGLENHVARQLRESLERLDKHIAATISKGAQVLSYHGSRDLAFKAQARARNVHPEFLVLVEPVDSN